MTGTHCLCPFELTILTGRHSNTKHKRCHVVFFPICFSYKTCQENEPPCIGVMEQVSLSCNRVLLPVKSVGRGWCDIVTATKLYRFNATFYATNYWQWHIQALSRNWYYIHTSVMIVFQFQQSYVIYTQNDRSFDHFFVCKHGLS